MLPSSECICQKCVFVGGKRKLQEFLSSPCNSFHKYELARPLIGKTDTARIAPNYWA